MIDTLQTELQLQPSGYTLARLLAWCLAAALATRLNRRLGIRPGQTLALAAIAIPLSVLGSRVLDALEYASAYPAFADALARNGSSIYGGLVLAWTGVWAWARWHGIPVLRLLDACAPAMALGESVSRIGCWVAGCCYGVPWSGPWAVSFPPGTFAFSDQLARGLIAETDRHTLAVHPAQLYAVVAAFGICVWLVRAFFRRRFDGQVFCLFLIAYGGLRLAMAPFRMEALGSMKFFSVAFIVAGIAGMLTRRPKMSHRHRVGVRDVAIAGVVAGLVLASPIDAAAQWRNLYQCRPDDQNCCANLATTNPTALANVVCAAGAPRAPKRPTLLMYVSDDNGYCHLGFMQGMCTESTFNDCSNNGGRCWNQADGDLVAPDHREWCVHNKCIKPCLSNVGCTGSCWSTQQFYDAYPSLTDLPLRLSDETCRNRFPTEAPDVGDDPNRGVFPFSRTKVQTVPNVDAHMITPHIDELASEGTVFPHAYTGGQRCQPGRTVLWNGLAVVHRNQGDMTAVGKHCALEPEYDTSNVLKYDTHLGAGIGCYLHNLRQVRLPPRTEDTEDYRTVLFGKRDIVNTNSDDFDVVNLGANNIDGAAPPNNCTDTPANTVETCQKRIRRGRVPFDIRHCTIQNDGSVDWSSCPDYQTTAVGIERLFSRIEKKMQSDVRYTPGAPAKPMYVWFAPNIPHDKAPSPDFLQAWYPDIQAVQDTTVVTPLVKQIVARVSLLDTSVGSVIDGFKRRCICTTPAGASTPQAQSLWDNTVMVFVNDNGQYLPDSKRQLTENGERMPMIVSEPARRQHVLRQNELASGMDVIPTLVSYAQEGQSQAPPPPSSLPTPPYGCGVTQIPALTTLGTTFGLGYPFTRNLCPSSRGTASDHVRSVYMTNLSFDGTDLKDHARVLVTRPGELGVCLNGNSPQHNTTATAGLYHVRVCRPGSTNPCGPGYTCTIGLGTTKGGRCANRPDVACGTDADCAGQWCYADQGQSPTCHNCMGQSGDPCCPVMAACPPYPNQYPEFNGKACSADVNCVPRGVCQQPVLRLVTDEPVSGIRHRLFDPNWDPDENTDLYGGVGPASSDYISDGLESDLAGCLNGTQSTQGFWTLVRHTDSSNQYQPLVWNTPSCNFGSYP